ncbi:hypothetical protein FB645_002024 [Coemansia sp. IMI 203386]|nr:hypothetical protein FB645_002024 [Coemansia sp. IMI 203386]
MRFPVFKKKTIGALVFVAWYMSFATFLISDPVFQLSKHQHDNSAEKAVYPVMVADACGFALASALGLASVVLPGEKAAPPGPAVAEQA